MLNHIKDLSPCAMTVFIRKPVEMEKRIVFSRFYPGQARFAHGVQGGYELTDWGRMIDVILKFMPIYSDFAQ
jgi:hypothetical protein